MSNRQETFSGLFLAPPRSRVPVLRGSGSSVAKAGPLGCLPVLSVAVSHEKMTTPLTSSLELDYKAAGRDLTAGAGFRAGGWGQGRMGGAGLVTAAPGLFTTRSPCLHPTPPLPRSPCHCLTQAPPAPFGTLTGETGRAVVSGWEPLRAMPRLYV